MSRTKKTPPGKPLSNRTRREVERFLLGKRIKSWKTDLDGCLRFLEGIPHVESIHGKRWITKMVDYYGGKAHELLAKPPKGCAKVVPHYIRRLREVEAFLAESMRL